MAGNASIQVRSIQKRVLAAVSGVISAILAAVPTLPWASQAVADSVFPRACARLAAFYTLCANPLLLALYGRLGRHSRARQAIFPLKPSKGSQASPSSVAGVRVSDGRLRRGETLRILRQAPLQPLAPLTILPRNPVGKTGWVPPLMPDLLEPVSSPSLPSYSRNGLVIHEATCSSLRRVKLDVEQASPASGPLRLAFAFRGFCPAPSERMTSSWHRASLSFPPPLALFALLFPYSQSVAISHPIARG